MAFFPKLNILYNSIPSTASDEIHKKLISYEMYDGAEQDEYVYEKIIYKSKFVKNSDFLHLCNWQYINNYPDCFDAYQFSVTRNPYDRMISIFFNLSNTHKDFLKFKPKRSDSIKDLQDKFENFFTFYKMFKNFNQGIGIEHLEILLNELKYPHEERLASLFFKNKFFRDSRLLPQFEILRSDWRQRSRFFRKKNGNNSYRVKVIKYENLKNGLQEINQKIFNNFEIKNKKSFKSISGFDYPSNYFFNERSRLLVGEYFEPDFDIFHYDPKIKLI